jgi:hypothetical protein
MRLLSHKDSVAPSKREKAAPSANRAFQLTERTNLGRQNLLDFFVRQAYDGLTSNNPTYGGDPMRIKTFVVSAIPVLIVALAWNLAAAAADQQSGTWKMNPEKSKYSPGPAAKSVTLTIEADENHYKVNAEGVDGNGNPTHVQFDAKFDGKDYPATGLPVGDMVSLKHVDASTIQVTQKKEGKTVMTVTSVVSKDGKTRTSTFNGKDAQGHDVNNVVVYDKQ